jgi:hypothetical protein
MRHEEAVVSGVLDCPPNPAVPVVLQPASCAAPAEGSQAAGVEPAEPCGPGVYALDLTPEQSRRACTLQLRLDGRLSHGRPISWPAPSFPLPPVPEELPVQPPPTSWPLVAGIVGGSNLLIGMVAWGLLWFIRRRQREQVAALLRGFVSA